MCCNFGIFLMIRVCVHILMVLLWFVFWYVVVDKRE
jgi:hypothetical protein